MFFSNDRNCGIVKGMETKETKHKPQKSTLLLILFLFFLLNAAHLFRTSINTIYFTEDISGDYAPVEVTVIGFRSVLTEKTKAAPEDEKLMPVFSFLYKEEETSREAPDFAFKQERTESQPYQLGEVYPLWIHKRWGTFMVPPVMGPAELGKSQLRISLVFLLLAVAIWILRNKIAVKGKV